MHVGPETPPHFFSEVVEAVAAATQEAAAAAVAVAAEAAATSAAATAGALSPKESPWGGEKITREFPGALLAPSLPRLRSEDKLLDPPTAAWLMLPILVVVVAVLSPSSLSGFEENTIRLAGAVSPRERRRAAGENFERRSQAGVSGLEAGGRPGVASEGRGGVPMMASQP